MYSQVTSLASTAFNELLMIVKSSQNSKTGRYFGDYFMNNSSFKMYRKIQVNYTGMLECLTNLYKIKDCRETNAGYKCTHDTRPCCICLHAVNRSFSARRLIGFFDSFFCLMDQ